MRMQGSRWVITVTFLLGLILNSWSPICDGLTDYRDVIAIHSLYISLNYPNLSGWSLAPTSDPCDDQWQGVMCVFWNVTGLILNGLNLQGGLGGNLNYFTSIMTIDLSNNNIGGSIPENIPHTVQELLLSDNQFTGSIPSNLSYMTNLLGLDLSGNKLSGQLPLSMDSLHTLNTLNLANNMLSGMLDVLQDLHLIELNIENNLFSGPIPLKLFNISNFRSNGNPFNTTPSPPVPPPFSLPPISPSHLPHISIFAPSPEPYPARGQQSLYKNTITLKIIFVTIGTTFIVLVFAIGVFLFMSRWCRKSQVIVKSDMGVNVGLKPSDDYLVQVRNQIGTGSLEAVLEPQIICKDYHLPDLNKKSHEKSDYAADAEDTTKVILPPPPVCVKSVTKTEIASLKNTSSTSENPVKPFTIALLQQITNSFSSDNFIGCGSCGSVYRAELPNKKLLAVKKLNDESFGKQSNNEFLQLVGNISKIKHKNVVEFFGYCAEHGQRLLVYEYCKNGTLYDALHSDEKIHKKLSWNLRIQIALGAARALEFMHGISEPPKVHQNFKSANIFLDEKICVRVSDYGLTPKHELLGYVAPECELGSSYTVQSDVYSFGIVMLELLTGRKSLDRSLPWNEQYLVRWAITQLHDIDLLSKMVDPTLKGAYPFKSLSRFADIISLCVQPEPGFRPPMSEIVQNLLDMIGKKT